MINVALLGTGLMGAAIARRLLAAGHRVTVWNRTPTRAAPLAARGASIAPTPAAAVASAEVVITMLTDAAAVRDALFADGVALRPGTTVIQMSTVTPDQIREIAARVPAGVAFVDAPVAGSVDAAAAGRLTILAGGGAPELLDDLGTVRECGPVGAGSAAKLVLNTAQLTALGGLRDALVVAGALGVRAPLDLLAAGPLQGVVARATSTTASFAIALAAKDLRLAVGDRTTTPVARAVLGLLEGHPDPRADVSALTRLECR
ncbi:NAD(P)-dependent oxidoreductase [Couchioplanes azureus]|uniref:NAD(P)-dependent oxidoreductase n=1 Tax=Couchioplanes caeruleus TaxID=56438 RepID=UPI0016712DDC|nr:NAD(P)-binding domain-containing protein [Couchioplanes caeruleus]GGQ48359.1 dehydrogenase [Couchioplanes caeruleus subsp. azureus]